MQSGSIVSPVRRPSAMIASPPGPRSPPSASRATLADYLDLLLPAAPDVLIDAAAHRRITALASTMLPIPRIAVECRLDGANAQVDLQQCLRRDDGEFPALAGYAASLATAHPQDESLACLSRFCGALAREDSSLNRGIEEIFLEYDLPTDADVDRRRAPAVFLSLPEDQDLARDVVTSALALLRPHAVPPPLQASIDRCFAACEGDACIAHVGIMLSRPVDVIRINVKGLRPAQIERFLSRCEWPGARDRAARLFDDAVDRVDRVTLALDVSDGLLPRVGVECILDEQPARDPSWRVIFRELCLAALCAPAKVDAFLSTPADIVPPAVARPWPSEFVLGSLVRPETEFSSFARRVIHFKITETLGVTREAKAYFGAGHLWLLPTPDPTVHRWRPTLATPRPRQSVASPSHSIDPIDRAIDRGVGFLLQQQLQSGLWRDFNVPTGISDEWASGFIGTQMALTGNDRARDAAEECYGRLRQRQRVDGGWGYNRDHPPDADSSSWVLRLVAALGHDGDDAARSGRDFVARHCLETGGVASYAERFSMAEHFVVPSERALEGLLIAHDCVTGAAVPFVPDTVPAYLRGRQQNGHWIGFWWVHDSYTTALAVEALRLRPASGDESRLAAAADSAVNWLRPSRDGSVAATAFDVAFCLRILVGMTGPAHVEAGSAAIACLLNGQQDDGSWIQGARLRVPLPGSVPPELITLDERRNFTTAAVVGALAAYRDSQRAGRA